MRESHVWWLLSNIQLLFNSLVLCSLSAGRLYAYPNGDDLLFVFIMLTFVCYVALLCIFTHLIIYLIIFDDIARLPVSEHQVHTYRLCILITASLKHSKVKPDNIVSKILN